jgi:hypothetical protein
MDNFYLHHKTYNLQLATSKCLILTVSLTIYLVGSACVFLL